MSERIWMGVRTNMVNWYECRVSGKFFEFLAGVKVDEILEDRLIINGLNYIDRKAVNIKQQTSNKIDEIFKDEKGIWLLEIQDGIYLFQAGITKENGLLCPVSDEPRFLNTLYVKLCCEKNDEVIALFDARILSHLFLADKQVVFIEMSHESYVTIEHEDGETAMFQCLNGHFRNCL